VGSGISNGRGNIPARVRAMMIRSTGLMAGTNLSTGRMSVTATSVSGRSRMACSGVSTAMTLAGKSGFGQEAGRQSNDSQIKCSFHGPSSPRSCDDPARNRIDHDTGHVITESRN